MNLSRTKVIQGQWCAGVVLDKHVLHSEFLGTDERGHNKYNNTRSELGECVYKLKYGEKDFSQVGPIADEIVKYVKAQGWPVQLVVPMPATNARARQPVTEISRAVAAGLNMESFENLLLKLPKKVGDPELKNLETVEEKIAALDGKIYTNDQIAGEGRWNALLIDDLYDSGATLNVAASILKTYRKINDVYVICCTWTKQ